MPRIILDDGFLRVTVRHVQPIRGIYYYVRRVPGDVQKQLAGLTVKKVSLRTRDLAVAAREAARLAREDEAYWNSLRTPEARALGVTSKETRDAAMAILREAGLEPGEGLREHHPDAPTPHERLYEDYFYRRYGHDFMEALHHGGLDAANAYLKPADREAVRLLDEDPSRPRRLLSDALEVYLGEHKRGADKRFAAHTRLAVGHVTEIVGDLPLDQYRRDHARRVRDALRAKGNKTGTVRRRFNAIVAVFNKGRIEFDMGERANPFAKMDIGAEGADAGTRRAFTPGELAIITGACIRADDDIRHIVTMLVDTGARLGEIVGLRVEDLFPEAEIPHLLIQPHERLGRTIKTRASNRTVPLLGTALWGARRALKSLGTHGQHGWLFPRYAADRAIRATHASGTINKWLRGTLKIGKTAHSFRHAMRDRLRHADVPQDFQQAIGGWGTLSIGQSYGEGYELRQLRDQLARAITWEEPCGGAE